MTPFTSHVMVPAMNSKPPVFVCGGTQPGPMSFASSGVHVHRYGKLDVFTLQIGISGMEPSLSAVPTFGTEDHTPVYVYVSAQFLMDTDASLSASIILPDPRTDRTDTRGAAEVNALANPGGGARNVTPVAFHGCRFVDRPDDVNPTHPPSFAVGALFVTPIWKVPLELSKPKATA